jgi:hypothetical protein
MQISCTAKQTQYQYISFDITIRQKTYTVPRVSRESGTSHKASRILEASSLPLVLPLLTDEALAKTLQI